MRIGKFIFTPKPWPSLATLVVLPLLIWLGLWQLDRAEQKRALFENFQQRQTATALDLNRERNTRAGSEDILWRRVTARGRFDEARQILLDNQVVKSAAGYFIYTPFKLEHEDVWLLVNRGWAKVGPDRANAPQITRSEGAVEITALAKAPPQGGLRMGENTPEQMGAGINRVQHLDLAQLSQLTGHQLQPFVLRLQPESGHGYVREWRQPGTGEAKHLGYAFQWFAMALALVVIFVVVNVRRQGQGAGD